MSSSVIYEPKGRAREYAALACNLYQGCSHGCRYCYAPACLHTSREAFHAATEPRPNILERLEAEAPKYAGSTEPVFLCFACDPYQPSELEHRVTRRALEILNSESIAWTVLTKGGQRATEDMHLFVDGWPKTSFGTSLCWVVDRDRRQWEPGAASVPDRLLAISDFHAAGIRTWLSIEPVIDPEQAVAVVSTSAAIVDEFRVGKLNHHPLAREIDWADFTRRIVAALLDTDCDYVIKQDLRQYLSDGVLAERRSER